MNVHNSSQRHFFHAGDYHNLTHRMTTAAQKYNIVMIGDSLMRYQYISMAYMLRHKQLLLPSMHPNLVEEPQWNNDFNQFFQGVNYALHPYEYCDCNHSGIVDVENRYYNDTKFDNVSLVYFNFYGDKVYGRWHPYHQNFSHTPWHYYLPDFIKSVVIHLQPKPNVLILNDGAWLFKHKRLLNDKKYFNEVYQTVINSFEIVIWKTTNAFVDHSWSWGSDRMDAKWCQQPKIICLNLSWTKDLVVEDFMDRIHFHSPVYWEITKQTLDILKID